MDSDTGQRDLLQGLISRTKEEFIQEFVTYDEASARKLCLLIFAELKNAVIVNNIDILNKLNKLINNIISANNKVTLQTYYNHSDNILKNTNIVILACKHDKQKSLQYLFDNYNFLNNINCAITPCDVDDESHNAFYYAIRLNHTSILQILIEKWPGINSDELDEVLSQAYQELKVKNVDLSNEMEVFVEDTLVNLRFYSDDSSTPKFFKITVGYIQERIHLVLENINMLHSEYLNAEVDETFLYIVTFIAKNIHVLKRCLRSTYNRLPWEEIEFCLVSFVKSYTKQEEIHLLYKSVLKKENLLSHLRNFAFILNDVKVEKAHVNKLRKLPNIHRDTIIETITQNYPPFKELYDDYAEIIDAYSLNRIKYYTDLAISADTSQKEEQLIVIRALQVIGEYMKNTLESPKLTTTTSELLLQSLQNDTREIITTLRNTLSHSDSLYRRTQIESNTGISFFSNIQNDIKKINIVITGILYNLKLKRVRNLLKKIINTSSIDEIREASEAFKGIYFLEMISETETMGNYSELEQLIDELIKKICTKTNQEIQYFNEVTKIIEVEKVKLKKVKVNYLHGLRLLESLNHKDFDDYIDNNIIRGLKFFARKALEFISFKIESHNFKDISKLLTLISMSVTSRMKLDDELKFLTLENIAGVSQFNYYYELQKKFYDAIHFIEFEIDNVKWVEELRDKLKGSDDFSINGVPKNDIIISDEKFEEQLTLKLSLLKNILNKNYEILYSEKNQTILEMLLLDVISILGTFINCLNENPLYLDNNLPILTGKNLRNHLAHGNTLIEILTLDPAKTLITNAEKLIKDNVIEINKKIGKITRYDFQKLKNQYNRNLITLINQKEMFKDIAEGNFEKTKVCIQNGADVRARTINIWTPLHFAAKSSNLELVNFLLGQNLNVDVRNVKGQTILHIAAIYASENIINFFILKQKILIDDVDFTNKTLLHYAAQNGHTNIIELLYKHKASTTVKDNSGCSPLHYAVNNGHSEAAKTLLGFEKNVNNNQTMGGYTSLHIASENGHLEIVNFLLEQNANVNAKNDNGGIPLHPAALNGHLDVVNALILKGSKVNSRVQDGCTPLHYAVENNQEQVVELLIKHGADVNVFDKVYLNTPLSYAAKDGYKRIVEILLKNNANVSMRTIEHMTALDLAASSGHLDIVTLLLTNKAESTRGNINEFTTLHLSACNGHTEVFKLILSKGQFNLNSRDKNKRTPLHLAAANGHKELINFLLSEGADINSVDQDGQTALHFCSVSGHEDLAKTLIENGAKINMRNNIRCTPLEEAIKNNSTEVVEILMAAGANINSIKDSLTALHLAAYLGHIKIVKILLNKNIDINKRGEDGLTPLHLAIENNQMEVSKMLIQRGCDIDAMCNRKLTSLCRAVKNNSKEIVNTLLESGADVNVENGQPLQFAIFAGHKNIVTILLRHKKINLKLRARGNITFLHTAAFHGDINVVKALLNKGIDVDTIGEKEDITPLFIAVLKNHKEVVEELLANKADANVVSNSGDTALHRAVGNGGTDVVNLLLNAGANTNIRDLKNRLPIELAVANGHLDIVKMLLKYTNVNIQGNEDWTMLHIAAQEGHFEVAKYLIEKGADIHALNDKGSKPIHIAAREGSINILEYLLDDRNNLYDFSASSHNLLHYASIGGQLKIVKRLIDKKFDVNLSSNDGFTPLHAAAKFGHREVVNILLNNGADYKNKDISNNKPVDTANDKDIIKLLTTTEELYEAVKNNNVLEVESRIKEGAVVNVQNSDNVTPLHHASYKGFETMVDILLKHQANPNRIGKGGCTPIHYATSFGHLKIVQKLLSHGAVHDLKTDKGKTPLDLAKHQDIIELLKLVAESFKNVQNGNSKVINDLNIVKDINTIKAIMNACNKENKTIIVAAIYNDFPKISQLKRIFEDKDVTAYFAKVNIMLVQEKFQDALNIYQLILEKRRRIFGQDNPAILDIQNNIASMLYKQQKYTKALKLYQEIYDKQHKILGINNKDTLNTRSDIGLVLHRLGQEEEALIVFKDVSKRQSNILGANDVAVLKTLDHMALVLDRLGKFDEALKINYKNYETYKDIYGPNHLKSLISQNNIAMVLNHQGNHDEAYKMYEYVYETRKMILGPIHSDTLRALHNMVTALFSQNKLDEAMALFQTVYELQNLALGPGHIDTIKTRFNMADILFKQGKYNAALTIYKESIGQAKSILGATHPYVLQGLKMMEIIKLKFKFQGPEGLKMFNYLNSDIHTAAACGDTSIIESLIINGTDVNSKDSAGRTPLHFAASHEHKDIITALLQHSADVTCVTNKGNTPLHSAVTKGNEEIVKMLLDHTKQTYNNKLTNLIDAKTLSGGSTALHVAVKNNFEDIVIILLQYGAAYNVTDNNNNTPSDLSTGGNLTNLFKLLNDFFKEAKHGSNNLVDKLQIMNHDHYIIITNARDKQGNTLLQVAMINKHKNLAHKLVEILKTSP